MRLTFRALAKAFLALLPPFFFSLPAICSGDQKCLSWRSTFALSVPLILRWYCLAFFFLATCLRCADGPRYTPSASVLSSSSPHTPERGTPQTSPPPPPVFSLLPPARAVLPCPPPPRLLFSRSARRRASPPQKPGEKGGGGGESLGHAPLEC